MSQRLNCLLFLASTFAAPLASSDCLVTVPESSAVNLPAPADMGWYGSDSLAVLIRSDGGWTTKDRGRNYSDKFWLWRRGYDAELEPRPDLVITGVRLDDADPKQSISVNNATNATNGKDKSSHKILVGLGFPSAGCWKLTARYNYIDIRHELTFVLRVED